MFRLESIFILVFLAIGGTAQAARMSIIVERRFTFEGPAAIEAMKFLGFSTDLDAVYELPWLKDSSECYKSEGQFELCDPTIRKNFLTYITGINPKITFSGLWYDGETGALPNVPKYTFRSPHIDSNELADWSTIIAKHAKELSTGDRTVENNTDSAPLIRIKSFEFDGHTTYYLGIDERSPAERKVAQDSYEKCLKKLEGNFFKNLFFGRRTGSC